MATKRSASPLATSSAKRQRQTSTSPSASPLTPLHPQPSTLLNLPAELRVHIYSFVFGNFIHVEIERANPVKPKYNPPYSTPPDRPPFPSDESDVWDRWVHPRSLRFYLCKSAVSEEDAYRRSQDSSLNEQLPGDEEHYANYWRAGDTFHIDPCFPRHKKCVPEKQRDLEWMLTPRERERQKRSPYVCIFKAIGIPLLQTCSKVYREAKNLPLSQSTFAFRDPLALVWMLSTFSLSQCNLLTSLCMFWTAGGAGYSSNAMPWNRWLLIPKLTDRLQGLRVIHLSISILHVGMGSEAPLRRDLHTTNLDTWVAGLKPLCELPLKQARVIISDDPDSKFGVKGYSSNQYLAYGWNYDHENWLHLRDLECFTADEKRGWAEQLRKRLLKET